MVLLKNADCLFVIFIVVRYSFLCYAIYWFLSQFVYGCNGYSGDFSLYSAVVFYVVIIADSLHWILVTVHRYTASRDSEIISDIFRPFPRYFNCTTQLPSEPHVHHLIAVATQYSDKAVGLTTEESGSL